MQHGLAYQNGNLIDLGAIENDNLHVSIMFAINQNNRAAGYSGQVVEKENEQGDLVDVNIQRAVYTDVGSDSIQIVPSFDSEDPLNMGATSLNDNGLIVGWGITNPTDDTDDNGDSIDSFYERGFIYDATNDILNEVLPVNYDNKQRGSVVNDINNNGIAVGWAHETYEDAAQFRSFYVDYNNLSNPVKIPASPDEIRSFANAINDSNQVVGKRQTLGTNSLKRYGAYIYDIDAQTITEIPQLTEGLNAQFAADNVNAFDINNSGQVVGTVIYDVVPDTFHAFIYENGETIDLNTRINCKVDPNEEAVGNPDWILYEARSINENGVIVGNGLLNSERHAFMLTPNPGVPAEACAPLIIDEDDDSGSGSFPLWMLGLASLAFVGRRRK